MSKKENIQKDVNAIFKKTLNDQLKAFKKDNSYLKYYKDYGFDRSEYLVRMFVLAPPDGMKPKGIIIEKTELQGVDPLNQKEVLYNEVVMPIAKIIKVGKVTDDEGNIDPNAHKEGDIVFLPTNKVVGMQDNPDFIHWMQFSEMAGAKMLGEIPPPKLPRFQLSYQRYQFTRLGNLFPDDQDKVTFLLPSPEIKGSYKI